MTGGKGRLAILRVVTPLAFALVAPGASAANAEPVIPCGGDAMAAQSPVPPLPRVEAWTNLAWHPPPCIPWNAGSYRFVAIITGPLRLADSSEFLARLGAISTTAGMRYWSESDGKWRVLVEQATALAGQDGEARGDFTKDEMRVGATLYFRDKDNRATTPVTYRMQVLKAADDEVIVESTNVSPVVALGFTFIPPGSFRLAHIARRGPDNQWTLRLVSAADARASWMIAFGKDSYVNRAMAVFAHVSGMPADTRARAQP